MYVLNVTGLYVPTLIKTVRIFGKYFDKPLGRQNSTPPQKPSSVDLEDSNLEAEEDEGIERPPQDELERLPRNTL